MRRFLVVGVFAALVLSLAATCVLAQVQNVELHGYMQNRFYANPSSSARWAVERISLSAVGKLGEDGTGYIEFYMHPWVTDQTQVPANTKLPPAPGGVDTSRAVTAEEFRTYLESAYVDLPFASGRIRIGKGRQLNFGMTPSYPNRKTTQYGILAETFTQDRIIGAQYAYKKGTFDFGTTFYSDQVLGTRNIGGFPGAATTATPGAASSSAPSPDYIKHITDSDVPGDLSGRLAWSGKFGWTTPRYAVHFSGALGGLNRNDIGNPVFSPVYSPVAAFVAGGVTTNTDHNKYGVDAQYNFAPFVAQAEAYSGHFSVVQITGYQVLLGYQPKDKTRAYVRYSALNNDFNATGANLAKSVTWDTEQLTVGIVQPIRKGVWAEFQYEKNMERPMAGQAQIDNDLLFVEFFTGF